MVQLEELEEVNDNESELHIQLRHKFLDEIGADYDEEYDIDDVDRIRYDDSYCRRFILHKKGDFDEAYAMLKEALAWRKSFGVKDCTEDSIPIEFFEAKGVFPYYYDKAGNPNIMILVRFHKKNPEFAKDIRRFVIYWVEKMEADNEGKQMTVVMSCTGAGLSNLDLDLIKFLIILFRSYYPHSLAHILIFEMPWIFNAAWKIIKSWLPEDFVEKIVFVNKTSITDFIDPDNLPEEMGGNPKDDSKGPPHPPRSPSGQPQRPPHGGHGSHPSPPSSPTAKKPPPKERPKPDDDTASVGGASVMTAVSSAGSASGSRRVHFGQLDGVPRRDRSPSGSSGISTRTHLSTRFRESSSYLLLFDDHCILAGMLKISPPQDLIFQPAGPKPQAQEVTIHLENVCEKAVTYKVKTNNIDNYRVKPALGIIEPREAVDIGVNLVRGKRPLVADKFLIMAMELPDANISMPSLSHMWRTTRANLVVDHKLRCVFVHGELTPHEIRVDQALRSISESIARVTLKLDTLEMDQQKNINHHKFAICLLLFFGILLWSHIICEYFGGLQVFFR